MKRIFLFFLPFLLFFTSSFNNHFEGKKVNSVDTIGYPITQFIGSDSALVKSRGGLMGRFAPIPFTDTTSANLSRISQYPGALIYTSSLDKYWYRNSTAKAWIEFTSSGGATVNIYNSNGVLTGERTVDGDGNGISFNSFRWFAVGADSVQFSLNSNVFRIFGLSETQDTTTYKPLVIDPITGRVLQSSYWFGGSGGGGGTTGIRFDSTYTPLGGSRGIDSFVVKSIRIRRNNITITPTQIGDSAMYWNVDVPDTASLSNRINEKLDKIGSSDSVSITVNNPIFRLIGLDAGIGGEDLLVIDEDNNVKKISPSSLSENLQTVLNNGSTLTGGNAIDATDPDNDYLIFGGGGLFDFISLNAKRYTSQTSYNANLSRLSAIETYVDSINLEPGLGNLRIDSLNSGSSTDSVLVWDASTGLVKIRNASAFSGGGGGSGTVTSVATNTGTGITGGTITTTGTIAADTTLLSTRLWRQKGIDSVQGNITSGLALKLNLSDTASMLTNYVRRQELKDTAAAIRAAIGGGGGSPAGNYGNVQLNRNSAFATPGSDSLNFSGGLSIKGTLSATALPTGGVAADSVVVVDAAGVLKKRNVSAFPSGTGTNLQVALWNGTSTITGHQRYTWTNSNDYPSLIIGAGSGVTYGASIQFRSVVGDYGSISSDGNQIGFYGLTGSKVLNFYSHSGGSLMLTLQRGTGGSLATFRKTAISVDTAVGGPSIGSVHVEYNAGDSTSAATDVGRHMFRGIGRTYANAGSFNTFYSTVEAGNTTYSQDHIIAWQSDAKKTGANTLNIIYHLGILGDSIKAGTVNNRWGVYMYDAKVTAGATLAHQTALRVPKLKAGVRNFDMFSDSAQTVKMDGNLLIGDSSLASSARKTIHLFNGTAPTSNISGAILYAESGELKARDGSGNVTILTDPSSGSPAGNYGNIQLNRNGTFGTPASDSLDFDAGLNIKGALTVTAIPTGGVAADSILVVTSAGVVKKRDAASLVGGGSGTVTSVGAGYGISGGTITTTGTHSLDTATVSGYYLRRKDSLTASNPLGYVTKKILADSLAARSYLSAGEGINLTTVVDTTTISIKYDTTALASFGAGAGLAGDTAAFSTSSIYGSFYNSGSDTLIITRLQIGLQGTSPSITATVYYNDSLNVTAGATKLVNAGSAATNIYTGTSVTSFDNTKIPPGVWVWVGTPTVTTKPTYFSLSLIGYKKRVTP